MNDYFFNEIKSHPATSAEDSRNAATRHRRESAAAMLCGGGTGNGMVSSQVASATYCTQVRKSHARARVSSSIRILPDLRSLAMAR